MSGINMDGTTLAVDTQDMITITSSGHLDNIMYTGTGMANTITNNISGSTFIKKTAPQDLLDSREMNLLVVEHKVLEMEMLKLKEVQPDYADLIKENIAKKAAKEVANKMTFTKKKLPDDDTHHFYGRVYVFTKEELIQLIEDARNA